MGKANDKTIFNGFLSFIVGQNDSVRALLKAGLIEGLAVAAFLFVATGTVVSGCHTKDTAAASGTSNTTLANVVPGSCFLGSSNLLNIAMAFGFMIFVLVYATASFTGGHLNPAVTLGFLVTKRISLGRAFTYIVFQCGGACAGSALIKALDHNGFKAALGAANQLNEGVSQVNAWGFETILTFMLVFVVFAATDSQRSAGTPHLPILAPIAIGMIVFLSHLVLVPVDHNQWIFWVGPFGGGLAAACAYELGLGVPKSRRLKKAATDTHGHHGASAGLGTFVGTEGLVETSHTSLSNHLGANHNDVEAQNSAH